MVLLERSTSIAFSHHSLTSLKKLILNDWEKGYACQDWCSITDKTGENLDKNKFSEIGFKRTVMQIGKALINDHLCVSKVSSKFWFATIYNFAVIQQ